MAKGRSAAQQRRNVAGMYLDDKQLIKALEKLPGNIYARAMRPVVNFAVTPVVKEAKAEVARSLMRTGLLRESLGKKVKQYKRAGVTMAMVGARRGFKRKVAERRVRKLSYAWRTGRTKRDVYVDPANYAHLPERGFRHRSGKRVRARPYMSPAWAKHRRKMVERFQTKIRKQVAKEWEKLNR